MAVVAAGKAMKKFAWLAASPWIVTSLLIASGSGCGADAAPSSEGPKSLVNTGGSAGAAGKASGGALAVGGGGSTSVTGGVAATGGVIAFATGGMAAVGGSSVVGGASGAAAGGSLSVGGTPGVSGSGGSGGGCPAGQTDCGGLCIDTKTSAEHCGGCGLACEAGRPCMAGVCACPMGQTMCGTTCADTQSDAANCGMCGNKCMAGTPCTAGTCTQGGMCTTDNMTYQGHITYYTLATEMVGCHYPTSSLPMHYAAMNTADYLAGAVCGACVEITNSQNGQKLTVLVADECPEASNKQWCFTGSHHIDLIEPAYRALNANNNPAITWKYVPCNSNGAIQYYFDKAAKEGYLAVTPMNHRHRITKMEVKDKTGKFIELKRSYYDMWESTVQLGPGPYTFRVTDMYGHAILDEGIALSPAKVVSGVGQFNACTN
jgi:expansin (peptidoglycan-binding protein)